MACGGRTQLCQVSTGSAQISRDKQTPNSTSSSGSHPHSFVPSIISFRSLHRDCYLSHLLRYHSRFSRQWIAEYNPINWARKVSSYYTCENPAGSMFSLTLHVQSDEDAGNGATEVFLCSSCTKACTRHWTGH